MARGDSLTHVVVLGSTGSIGKSALSVIEHDGGARLKLWGLSAHSRWAELAEQARHYQPRYVVVSDETQCAELAAELHGTGIAVLSGSDGIERMVRDDQTDRVLVAIVGAAGLRGTWAALDAGKTVALANKETLVMGGPLVMELSRARARRSCRSTASIRRSSRP